MPRSWPALSVVTLLVVALLQAPSSAHRYRCTDGHALQDSTSSRTFDIPSKWPDQWKKAIKKAASDIGVETQYEWRFDSTSAFTQWAELGSTDPSIAGATSFRNDGCAGDHSHVRTVGTFYRNKEHAGAYNEGFARKVCTAIHEFGHGSILDHVGTTNYRSVMYADHWKRCHDWTVDDTASHDVDDVNSLY